MNIDLEWRHFDVLVIGSGGAGTNAAESAAKAGASVLLVAKDPLSASDTKISEGIATVRASGSEDDTEEALSENLKIAGSDLHDDFIEAGSRIILTNSFGGSYSRLKLHGFLGGLWADREGYIDTTISRQRSMASYLVILLPLLRFDEHHFAF